MKRDEGLKPVNETFRAMFERIRPHVSTEQENRVRWYDQKEKERKQKEHSKWLRMTISRCARGDYGPKIKDIALSAFYDTRDEDGKQARRLIDDELEMCMNEIKKQRAAEDYPPALREGTQR